jgi:hypothetical protein
LSARLAFPSTLLVAALVAACGVPVTADDPRPPAPTPGTAPAPTPTLPLTGIPFVPTPPPDGGDVEASYPELTVEELGGGRIVAGILDPLGRAWRVVVAGSGPLATDRLEILVETSDIGPIIEIREFRDGQLVDVADLSRIVTDHAGAAGGCHGTLGVCWASDGFRLPADGNGELLVRLDIRAVGSLEITGGTARWTAEPFILGPWKDTETFPWPMG